MLIDDFNNFYNIETGQQVNNAPYTHTSTIPSSFRPNQNTETSAGKKQIKLKMNSKSCNDILMCNEYDAIESNTTTTGSYGNISAVTSYSEVLTDEKMINTSNESDVNFHYLNNNELISSTSILTQELETKLKERRQMIESRCDKYQQKSIDINEKVTTL